MKMRTIILIAILCGMIATVVAAPRQMENLDRGVVVIRQDDDTIFVGWRLR
jgi:hypothetical protein